MQVLKNRIYTGIFLMVSGLFIQGCIEPFVIEATEFESIIVVEGTLTDQIETQRIQVSRTFPLDTVLATGIGNATVLVTDSNGTSYSFTGSTNGEYRSNSPFSAVSGVNYVLTVDTPDGKNYRSEPTQVTAKSTIDNLYAIRETKDNGAQDGIFVYVDSFDPTGESKYYRYEYEETFKIIAPFWSPDDAFAVSQLPNPQVDLRPRTREERICYRTETSNTIIQENTTKFNEDRVSKFPVRFISSENYILSHRYSILVKQFIQTRTAYSYYETLAVLSSSGSLFSQIQNGFLEGNIKSSTDPDEKVIGFFQASSVTQERLYFDYIDFFEGERLPDYPFDCDLVSPPLITEGPASPLVDAINLELLKYYQEYNQETNPNGYQNFGPYLMIQTPCGDCNLLGNNVIPEFWVE